MNILSESNNPWSVAIIENSNLILSGGEDSKISIWKLENDTFKYKAKNTYKGHTRCINCVTISRDGKYIFSANDDRKIKIWKRY